MKYHINQNDSGITICTLPFMERIAEDNNTGGGANSTPIEVNSEDVQKIMDPSLMNVYKNGKLTFKNRSAPKRTTEELKREELKNKIKDDSATLDDIKEYLKLTI